MSEIDSDRAADQSARHEESDRRYRLLFETMNQGVIYQDAGGHIVSANPAAERILGLSLDQMLGRTSADPRWHAIRPDGTPFPGDEHPAMEALRSGQPVRGVQLGVFHPAENGYRWIVVDAIPDFLPGESRPYLVHTIFTDITERLAAESSQRDSEEKYRRLFDAESDAIFLIDNESGRILEANSAAVALYGYSREALLSVTNEDLSAEPHETRRATKQEVPPEHVVTIPLRWHRKQDGTVFPVEITARFFVYGGRPVHLAAIRDVSARLAAEEALRQAQKMESIGRLAGGVAHDFNNMLQTILGRCDLAIEEPSLTPEVRSHLIEVREAAERSAALTRQLLGFARKQAVSPRPLDLNAAVSAAMQMLRRLIGENVAVAWRPGPGIWSVDLDPSQLDQILTNLAVNARDAIEGTGTLTIETANVAVVAGGGHDHPDVEPGEYVVLTVSDTGRGMTKDVLDRLFEPFFTTKAVGTGTGLGLATVYGIVKQNNGAIDVSSAPGAGTRFRIYLPRGSGTPAGAAADTVPSRADAGTETILFVEDDPAILGLGEIVLSRLGYTVLTARTPGDALARLAHHDGEVHLLVTDVVMPEMNGRQLAASATAARPGLKTLFMSGYTADVIAQRDARDADIAFLQKPFHAQELARRVREVLDRCD